MEIPKLGIWEKQHMGVSENRGTPKSSIFIGISIINHPFWGFSHYSWKNIHINQNDSPPFLFFRCQLAFVTTENNPSRLEILSTELLALHLANNELQWLPNKLPQALQVLDLRSLGCSQKKHR